jgi:hypothetical protein
MGRSTGGQVDRLVPNSRAIKRFQPGPKCQSIGPSRHLPVTPLVVQCWSCSGATPRRVTAVEGIEWLRVYGNGEAIVEEADVVVQPRGDPRDGNNWRAARRVLALRRAHLGQAMWRRAILRSNVRQARMVLPPLLESITVCSQKDRTDVDRLRRPRPGLRTAASPRFQLAGKGRRIPAAFSFVRSPRASPPGCPAARCRVRFRSLLESAQWRPRGREGPPWRRHRRVSLRVR